jgi:hypothetical protein
LLTSRTYIWRAAYRDLKTSAFPLFDQSQVVIDVQGLQPSEKAQILYNHIKLGDQTADLRTQIKPFLADVAADPGFLPETARRLGSKFFTTGLKLDRASALDLTRRPVEFLRDVLRNLDRSAAGAVALLFMHGGRVASPIESDERMDVIGELLGVTAADLRQALETLRGSIVLLIDKPEGQFWTFKHPTIADAYASLVADSPELTEIYLRGAQYDKLLNEITCGAVAIEGAAVGVPARLYPILLNRIASRSIDYRTRYFLAQRCDRDFLASAIERIPTLLDMQVTPFMAYSSETQVLARLHEFGLLPEDRRRKFVDNVAGLTITIPDGAVLRDDGLRSLFTENEFVELKSRIREEVVERLSGIISEWESDCPADDDPESYFDELESMLGSVEDVFDDEPDVARHVAEGRQKIKIAIDSLNEDRPEPISSKIETPTGQATRSADQISAIFDDLDE